MCVVAADDGVAALYSRNAPILLQGEFACGGVVKQMGQLRQGFHALPAVAIKVTVTAILIGDMAATASFRSVRFPLLI
jgi:hypothetical protein